MTKWAIETYLSIVDTMLIGFVSRKDVKNNKEHVFHGFHNVYYENLMKQLNYDRSVGWGILKNLSETLLDQPDGKYVLSKQIHNSKQYVKLMKLQS